jgi:predicted nucleotidyltransferase
MEQGRVIFKCRIGSHLYGLNTPESDEDFMGVFIPRSEYLLGLKNVEEVDNSTKKSSAQHRNSSEDVDDKYYSLPKFLHLVLQNNPNIVEVLFATPENVLITSDEWEGLVSNRNKILSHRVYHTFKGYAFSQKKKLTVKAERYLGLQKAISFIERNFDVQVNYQITEKEAEELNKRDSYYKGEKQNCESFHKGMHIHMIYGKLKDEYENYGWRVKTDTFLTLGYDVKFGYHLIRILAEGYELLRTGELQYPIMGEPREDIVRVRTGQVKLKELLEMYERWEKKCDLAFETTNLRKKPDFNFFDKWLVKTLKKSITEEG